MALNPNEKVENWQVEKMLHISRAYFHDIWSKGSIHMCDYWLDDDFVHKENIWHPDRLVAGPHAFKKFVEEIRLEYPDLNIEVQQIAVSDSHRIFVLWEGSGTNLNAAHSGHPPSRHESHMAGVDIITFNRQLSHILEVSVFRRPTREEREEVLQEGARRAAEGGINLNRLHFEGSRKEYD